MCPGGMMMNGYFEVVPVTLATDTAGAEIWYRILKSGGDAEDPPFTQYTGIFDLTESASVEAYTKYNGNYSALVSKYFWLNNPVAPVFTPIDTVQKIGSTITITAAASTKSILYDRRHDALGSQHELFLK